MEELEAVEELSKVCSHIVLKCLYLARIVRPVTRACDKRLARFSHKSTSRVISGTFVMWEIPLNNADGDCFKTQTLHVILKILDRPRGACYASSGVERLYQ